MLFRSITVGNWSAPVRGPRHRREVLAAFDACGIDADVGAHFEEWRRWTRKSTAQEVFGVTGLLLYMPVGIMALVMAHNTDRRVEQEYQIFVEKLHAEGREALLRAPQGSPSASVDLPSTSFFEEDE